MPRGMRPYAGAVCGRRFDKAATIDRGRLHGMTCGEPSRPMTKGTLGGRREATTGGHAVDRHATADCWDMDHKPRSHNTPRIVWAKLMARVGDEFPLLCPACGRCGHSEETFAAPEPLLHQSRIRSSPSPTWVNRSHRRRTLGTNEAATRWESERLCTQARKPALGSGNAGGLRTTWCGPRHRSTPLTSRSRARRWFRKCH
jgi:hypothetical protein